MLNGLSALLYNHKEILDQLTLPLSVSERTWAARPMVGKVVEQCREVVLDVKWWRCIDEECLWKDIRVGLECLSLA